MRTLEEYDTFITSEKYIDDYTNIADRYYNITNLVDTISMKINRDHIDIHDLRLVEHEKLISGARNFNIILYVKRTTYTANPDMRDTVADVIIYNNNEEVDTFPIEDRSLRFEFFFRNYDIISVKVLSIYRVKVNKYIEYLNNDHLKLIKDFMWNYHNDTMKRLGLEFANTDYKIGKEDTDYVFTRYEQFLKEQFLKEFGNKFK